MTAAGSILIVDDDPDARTILQRVLSKEGYEVESIDDGLEALAQLAMRHFDLLITDLQMPMVGGRELLEKVKASQRDTDVLLISAVGSIPVAVEMIKSGALDFIEKPFDLESIRTKVRSAFEQRRKRMEGRRDPDEDTLAQLVSSTPQARASSVPTAVARPERVGRYRLGAHLGSGGMGEVFEAFDPTLGRKVAVKLLKPPNSPDHREEVLERFQREAWVTGRLKHPHIATVYDFGQDPDTGVLFLVMELVEGTSLRQLMRESGPLPVPRALSIIGQVAEALAHAHHEGFIHRDIKPENILIGADDQTKLVDFGIAKITESNLTGDGRVLGSPSYISPEMAGGDSVDTRSDQFSLGTVLIEMLTGAPPFRGETVYETLGKVRNQPSPGINEVAGRRIARLRAFVERLHQKNPADRFASDEELLEALRSLG